MEPQKINKGDRNKIYFLVIVIAALIGTNAYLFFKDRKQSERFVTISTEKDKLRLEVEKIEVELDKTARLVRLDAFSQKPVERERLVGRAHHQRFVDQVAEDIVPDAARRGAHAGRVWAGIRLG